MSMPRAAMSVATSTSTPPSLKSASARVRAPWLLLPWIATARMPSLLERLRELVGAVLGAREHEHLAPALLADQARQELALAVAVDRMHALA